MGIFSIVLLMAGGPTQSGYLQSLIDAATAAGQRRVELPAGEHFGPLILRGRIEVVGSPNGLTVILGNGSGTVVRVMPRSDVLLESLEVRGARIMDEDREQPRKEDVGGGIFISAKATATLRAVRISDCQSIFVGSAIEARHSSKLTIERSVIAENRGWGSQMVPAVSVGPRSALIISDTVFRDNLGGEELYAHGDFVQLVNVTVGRFSPSPLRPCESRLRFFGLGTPRYFVRIDGLVYYPSGCATAVASPNVDVAYRNMDWPEPRPKNIKPVP